MKTYFTKYSFIFIILLMMWSVFPASVNAEEKDSHCYPSEEEIHNYKEDGTWEKRQEYAKKLNYSKASEELLYYALQREYGFTTYAAGDDIPEEQKGMQVTGDANMLLVRVEFADVKFADSKIYSEEELFYMVMGNGDTGNFPYESLNAYYKRSSYNKLNIFADQVYSCSLSQNREYYEDCDDGEQKLIKEVLEMLDDMIDFKEYDANQDDRFDGICITFAGENTGWGSTWWSHKYDFQDSSMSFDGVTPAGYIFLETYQNGGSYGTQTLIHEVGHLLGLPDYYGKMSDGIGTTDMMNNNRGDHNGFSKWLLGWIEEENILRITRADGDTEVSLSPLAVESPGTDKLIAVVAPEDTSIYSEYFVVQYDEYMGNQSFYELENPAYRIFHVDASLNEDATNFEQDNLYAYDNHFLIRAVPVVEGENRAERYYYFENDAFTPDTDESSAFYGGNILGFTGIEMTDFVTGDSPVFHVSFREKEVVDGTLEFEIAAGEPLNMAELMLLSNKPLVDAGSYEMAYLEDSDGNQYFIDLYFEDGSFQLKTSYINIAHSLKPETEYTLVIPEGMFKIDKGVYSDECRLTVKTGKFPEIEVDFAYEYGNATSIISLSDTKSGFIDFIDRANGMWKAQLHVFEDTDAVDVTEVNIPIPGSYNEIVNVKAVACYDGAIAVGIQSMDFNDYSKLFSYYKIDQNGNVLAGPFSIEEELNIFPAGTGIKGTLKSSGAVGAPDLDEESKLEIYTVDFENEPVSRLNDVHKSMSSVYALDEESYLVVEESEEGHNAVIYNNQDERIKTLDISAHIDGVVCSALKSEGHLVLMCSTYLESGEYGISISRFDMDGTYLGTHDVSVLGNWKDVSGWVFEKTSWGYGLYNRTREQTYMIYLLNDAFELISSMQLPDSISSGTHMGNRVVIKWYDLTTWGNRVAITEPIVIEETDPPESDESEEEESRETEIPETEETKETETSETEETKETETSETEETKETETSETEEIKETVTPSTEKPTDESGKKDDDQPDTGDTTNLKVMILVMMISGSIIVNCLTYYLLRHRR